LTKLIEFKNVTKEYHTGENILKAANNLNFTINKGEFVVILGPSGSGKSTLLNLLGGLDNVTNGNIIIDNTDISQYNENQLTQYRADKIGFIFQFYNLIPNLTALENIELINEITSKKIDGIKYLQMVNMEQHKDQFPSQLSGGEQQRVSKQPSMLLCDEPTGALDSKSGYNIIKLLLNLSKNKQSTVIIVTHNAEISKLADKVIYLKNGQIEKIDENSSPLGIDEIEW